MKCAIIDAREESVNALKKPSTRPQNRYSGSLSREKCIIEKNAVLNTTEKTVPYLSYSANITPLHKISSQKAGTRAKVSEAKSMDESLLGISGRVMSVYVKWDA